MRRELVEGALLFAPLVAGYVLHGLSMKYGWFRFLAFPIDAGACLRGKRLFGDNKTYRGIVVIAMGASAAYGLLSAFAGDSTFPHLQGLPHGVASMAFGFTFGAAAMAGELPNSLIKRQLGIQPGSQTTGIKGWVFHLLDQVDVLAGGWIVLAFAVTPTVGLTLGSLLFIYFGHQIVTVVGHRLGMRATPR
ncbi:MAG: hypothetical protein AMXMBFR84_28380 [Candidatus Hydrogenedentota bacterium]